MRPFAADKIFAHADRIEEWLRTGTTRPVTYELDLTNACGHKCPRCFGFHPGRDASKMSLGDAKDILRQIKDLGGRGVTFTGGGDPLMSPAAPEAVEHAASLGLDAGFITNGQGLTPEAADVLIRSCVWLRVSLDAAGPEVFKATHGMGPESFERVLGNVRLLSRRKRELGSACTLGLGFLTSPETKSDIRAFVRLGRELGADYAQYRPLLRANGAPDPDYSDLSILDEIKRAQAECPGPCRVVCSEHKYRLIAEGRVQRSYGKCYGQHFAAVVAADRKMYVCCHMRGIGKYAVGDLGKDSLREIWRSSRRREIADSVDFRDCPALCRCDSFNGILWDLKRGVRKLEDAPSHGSWSHPSFI